MPGFVVYCLNGGKKLSKHTRVLGSTASIPLSLLKLRHLKGVDVIYERPWSWTSLGLELSHELQCDDVDQIKVQIVLPPRRTCVDRINGIPTCSFSLAHPDRIVQIRVHSRFEFQIGHFLRRLIFKFLYFVKLCTIFVGSFNNFVKSYEKKSDIFLICVQSCP